MMSVNLSPRQVAAPTLVDDIARHPRARPASRPTASSSRSPRSVLLDEAEASATALRRAAGARRPARARRLRDRLLVAVVPAAAAARHDQDRPIVRRRDRRGRLEPADRPGRDLAGPRPRDRGRRRGDRDRGPVGAAAGARAATAARASTTRGRSRPRRSGRCSRRGSRRPAEVRRPAPESSGHARPNSPQVRLKRADQVSGPHPRPLPRRAPTTARTVPDFGRRHANLSARRLRGVAARISEGRACRARPNSCAAGVTRPVRSAQDA